MIDLESFIGKFVWQEITLNGSNFVVPTVTNSCFSFFSDVILFKLKYNF